MARLHTCCVFLTFVTLAGCSPDSESTPRTGPAATRVGAEIGRMQSDTLIVAMGDSLTEGLNVDPEQAYPAQLERKLRAAGHDVRVVNAGIAGETSTGARARVDWVLRLKPDLVILETGANDGLRGVDPQVTAGNIDRILTRFGEEKVEVILAGMQIVQNMGQQYVEEFRAIYPAAAKSHEIPLIPFFLEGVAANPNLNQPDGIHPTAEGYSIVVDTMEPYILEALRD